MASTVEGAKVRRQMQFMEDEDEVIEHKPVYNGGRRDSKRSIPALLVSVHGMGERKRGKEIL